MPLNAMLCCLFALNPVASMDAPVQNAPDGASVAPNVVLWESPNRVAVAELLGGHVGAASGLAGRSCDALIDVNGVDDNDMPRAIAFWPDGSKAAVVGRDSDNVTIYDVATRTVLETVGVGDGPVHCEVSPDGSVLVTTNLFSDDVTVIDGTTFEVIDTVALTRAEPYRVRITPDGARAVVGCADAGADPAFVVVDLATRTVERTISAVQGIYGGFGNTSFPISGLIYGDFRVAPDSTRVILPIGETGNHRVELHDITTGALINSIPMPATSRVLDVARDGSIAAVGVFGQTQMAIIDLTTNALDRFVTTPGSVRDGIALAADGSTVAFTDLNDTYVVDLTTDTTLRSLGQPSANAAGLTADGTSFFTNGFQARSTGVDGTPLAAFNNPISTYDTVVSQGSADALGLNNRFGERLHWYDTDGANAAFLAATQAGDAPEGDYPYEVAITPDGATAVVGMGLSGNVAIIDLNTQQLSALVETGTYVNQVAITPDGATALSCDRDSQTVSVIDIASATVLTQLLAPTRPSQIAIHPDGTEAYVLSIAGTDAVHFIDIDGASSSVTGVLPIGQAGGSFGVFLSETSGIALSPDGSTLAVCDSFNDRIRIVDTATQSIVASAPVGDFPIRCDFSPDGSLLFCTNFNDDTASIIEVNGAASQTLATLAVGDRPLVVHADADGRHAYVVNANTQSPGAIVSVLDAQALQVVRNVSLGGPTARDGVYDAAGDVLYVLANDSSVTSTGSQIIRVDAAGASAAVLDRTDRPSGTNALSLAVNPGAGVAVASVPFLDAVDVVCVPVPCPADLNDDDLLDFFDVSAFLAAFNAQDPVADFNGDDLFDFFDVSAFLDAFNAGC